MSELLYKELSFAIIGTAMEVHSILGPGFLGAVCQKALAHEFSLRGIKFDSRVRLPVIYTGEMMGEYVPDFGEGS